MRKSSRFMSVILAVVMLLCIPTAVSGCALIDKFKKDDEVPVVPDDFFGTDEVIKIGVFEPLSGANEQGGKSTLEGILMAHEERPIILGRRVQLVQADNKSTPEGSVEAAKKLVDDEQCIAVVGTYGSSSAIAGGPIFHNAGVPAVGCSPTNPAVTLGNPYYFRVCFIDPFQGAVGANFAKTVLGAHKAALVVDVGDDYSTGLGDVFEYNFNDDEANTEVAVSIKLRSDQESFGDEVKQIKDAGVDVIYMPSGHIIGAKFVRACRESGIQAPFVSGDTWENDELIAIAGAENVNESVYVTSHFSSQAVINEIGTRFIDTFKEKYKKEPSAFAALGYDAYMILMEAIDRATQPDPAAIRSALASTKLYIGVTGTITLDANGDAVKDAVILNIVDGKVKYLQSIAPDRSK